MRTFIAVSALLLSTTAQALPAGKAHKSISAATEAARVRAKADHWQGATQRFTYEPGGLYQVHTAVGRVTDIMLQPGETLSDTGAVAAGDTVRWVIGEATSGSGPTRATHILVKPTEAGLVTNLVISTNRRSYHVELRSSSSTYMASIAWSYPQDELIALRASAEQAKQLEASVVQREIDPTRLNFAYQMKGADAPWRPAQVFDDGQKTYILFPQNVRQSELPPLFLIGEKGKAELVNYRVAGRYMIVDRLFSVAELRLGSKKQEIVRIQRVGTGELRS